ncbi:MAG: winged helix-turn-helix domain-containing protein [Klebsiella sp.]|uniref:winged helix-turn-helix domain-containing protein n=1 Tax=Klebsiella sp. TaxID=576 RepID=UPI00189139FD|nr:MULTISPECIES: winged helix-turn-helix domain-containing protein [Klebsiella]MBS6906180.1 winged helix-turn-helix domain-containing protein [Klebsiella sp.]
MEKIYKINERIAFIPQCRALILIADDTRKVSLNIPASRCLLLLIQQYGNAVAREIFFQEVWINHGLQVTSNGFYQNISLLRRAFKKLGVEEDIIVTVPRVGVRLDATLTIAQAQPAGAEDAPVAEVESAALMDTVPKEVVPEKKRLRPQRSLKLAVAALLFCLMIGFFAWQTEFESYLQNLRILN